MGLFTYQFMTVGQLKEHSTKSTAILLNIRDLMTKCLGKNATGKTTTALWILLRIELFQHITITKKNGQDLCVKLCVHLKLISILTEWLLNTITDCISQSLIM